eukprot:764831-Hanusia_phi.AAC.3
MWNHQREGKGNRSDRKRRGEKWVQASGEKSRVEYMNRVTATSSERRLEGGRRARRESLRARQVIFGSYRIAQVREPYSVVRFIAEKCDPPLSEVSDVNSPSCSLPLILSSPLPLLFFLSSSSCPLLPLLSFLTSV